LHSARTTALPTKPDPPKTVTRVSRFDAMGEFLRSIIAGGVRVEQRQIQQLGDTPMIFGCTAYLLSTRLI
jgi:hypothetical protein